jgi:glycosyltransferase involved in cell wall biosynthesis
MQKKTFIYDLTRLASRRYQDTPSGIDRIDIRFADDMLKKRSENCYFVVYVFGSLKLMPNPIAEHLINELFARWEDSQPANYSIAKIIDQSFFAPNFDCLKDHSDDTFNLWKRFSNLLGKGISYVAALFSYLKGRYFLQSSKKMNRKLRDIFEKQDCSYLTFAHTGFARDPSFPDFCGEYDVQTIAYIHDLIPIEYPQYCKPDSAQRFQQFIDQLLKAAPLVLTNSNATQTSLKSYIENHENADISKLSLEMHTLYPGVSVPKPEPDFTPPPSPYFVMLGTIEPRKNHELILDIWEELVNELGDKAPALYIIGKRGWLNEKIFEKLDTLKKQAKGKVIEKNNTPSQLATNLLANANALLFPSLCEGLGIPLIESIILATPVLASEIDITEEINTKHIERIDIDKKTIWKDKILALTNTQQTNKIPKGARIFNWKDTLEDLKSILSNTHQP